MYYTFKTLGKQFLIIFHLFSPFRLKSYYLNKIILEQERLAKEEQQIIQETQLTYQAPVGMSLF